MLSAGLHHHILLPSGDRSKERIMQIIDCNVAVGRPINPSSNVVADPGELLSAMDAAGVDQALIWHVAQHNTFPQNGNKLVCEFGAGEERLMRCWTALPPVTDEIPLDELFAGMKASGVFALRLFPDYHRYQPNAAVLSDLLDRAIEANLPLILSLERGMTWSQIFQLMADFPKLTLILADVGVWGQDRNTWPLLQKYPNVFVETSLLALEAGGVACGVKKFGAERFVFGSGFPDKYIEAPLLEVLHSDIAESDKELILSGNILRMKAQVKL
jgi:predicted TIM-barrel fold metal-dependent hydrolase